MTVFLGASRAPTSVFCVPELRSTLRVSRAPFNFEPLVLSSLLLIFTFKRLLEVETLFLYYYNIFFGNAAMTYSTDLAKWDKLFQWG